MADISKFNPDGGATEYNFKDTTARNIRGNYYGTCTGQAANQTKAVTISEDQGFELKTGVLIFVKFDANNSYNATSSNPVKLNVNSTGAKQIYAANTSAPTGTNTTYFGRTNYINQYIYNGTYWVWNGSSSDNTVNTQVRYADAVKAAAAVTASTICVGTSSGYKTAASGITFDISYPILYATSDVSSGSTGTNFYRVVNNRSAASLKSGFSGVAHNLCYLVLSSINGNIATVDSSVYTVTPNSIGKFYIPIGIFLDNTTKLDIDITNQTIFVYDGSILKLYSPDSGGGGGGGDSNRVYISPFSVYREGIYVTPSLFVVTATHYDFVSPYITDNSLFELICDEEGIDPPTNIAYDISNNTITISFDGDTTDKTFVLIAEAISISN